ncbi:MAG: AarF/ABC1/UbiB kinase family protein [Myxococcota bacterium]
MRRVLDRSGEALSTGRMGRAFKMGKLAASAGSKVFADKARALISKEKSSDGGVELALEMVESLAELRGVAMKVGQMLSYIDDSLPPEAQRVLGLLQRSAPPMPFPEITRILEAELGAPLKERFAEVDPSPLAAASIGQVHRGRLPSGQAVAIKVQYPGIQEAMRSDLKNAKVLALFKRVMFYRVDSEAIMNELEERLLDECDYQKEADYQETFGARFEGHPTIVVPKVYRDHTTSRVLTTELMEGHSFHEWLAQAPSPEARAQAGRTFYRFYLGAFYLDGLFNCDPHPGNYLFRDDGKIVFLDYGCSRRFPDDRRALWVRMVHAVREDQPQELHEAATAVGFLPPGVEYDRASFRALMRYLYEPYLTAEPYDFSLHKPMRTFRELFITNPNLFKLNMPSDAVFLNRITFGLVSLLTAIGAPVDCYALANGYFERKDLDWPEDPALLK